MFPLVEIRRAIKGTMKKEQGNKNLNSRQFLKTVFFGVEKSSESKNLIGTFGAKY